MFFCMKLRTKSFTEISKRANILLDSGFNARLSYFGLAREGPKDDRSYVTAEFTGTQSYAAPEYLLILIDSMQKHEIF